MRTSPRDSPRRGETRGTGADFDAPDTGKSTPLRAILGRLTKAACSVRDVSRGTCAVLDLFREIPRGFSIERRYRKADVIREVERKRPSVPIWCVRRPAPGCTDADVHTRAGLRIQSMKREPVRIGRALAAMAQLPLGALPRGRVAWKSGTSSGNRDAWSLKLHSSRV